MTDFSRYKIAQICNYPDISTDFCSDRIDNSSTVSPYGPPGLVLMLRAWPRFDVRGNDVTGTGSDRKSHDRK